MKNKKIYINGRFLTQELTGVQRVAGEICLHLQNYYKDELIFLCPDREIINPYGKYFKCKKIGVFSGVLWEQIELPLFLHKKNASLLINLCNPAPILFNRNIVVIHDMATKQSGGWFDWKIVGFYNFMFYFTTKFSKKIITISNFSKSEILKYYPKLKSSDIEVIYQASFIEPRADKIDDKKYFLTVGSLNKRKNLSTIVEAFKKLDPAEYHLKIVGSANKKVFGEEPLLEAQNIEYLGNVGDDELYRLISESRALINASLYEGFGLPPLESMSLSTPCILSRIPVYEELYHEVALFFDALNSDQLVQKIKEMKNLENYSELCNTSYKFAQKFSWERTSKGYIDCIEKVLKIS